jgi:hypothetical protein
VDGERILHVDRDKVIVPSLRAGILRGAEFGRRFGETCDGGDVSFLLCGGGVAPVVAYEYDWPVVERGLGNVPFPTHLQLGLGACC